MYESKTADVIRQQILNNTGSGVSAIEGSFTSDMAAASSLIISSAYGQIDKSLTMMFVDGLEGADLDKRCGEYGIIRKTGNKATGTVTFTGVDGTIVPIGTVVMTDDGLQYTTNAAATIASGTVAVGITAASVGTAYNVSSGQIARLYRNLVDISEVVNASSITGGLDEEKDDALRARLLIRMRTPATSGNVYHYLNWALEVDGVGAAKILPLWAGPGTVGVLVVGSNHEPVTSDIVTACSAHIEEERPIGATVTVASATGLNVTVTATVTVSTATTVAAVQADFIIALKAYLQSIAFVDYTLSYNKIAFVLMSVPGVLDYTLLRVNGGTANITIGTESVPVYQGVTLS